MEEGEADADRSAAQAELLSRQKGQGHQGVSDEDDEDDDEGQSAGPAGKIDPSGQAFFMAYLNGLSKAELLKMPLPGIGASKIEAARSARGKQEIIELILMVAMKSAKGASGGG